MYVRAATRLISPQIVHGPGLAGPCSIGDERSHPTRTYSSERSALQLFWLSSLHSQPDRPYAIGPASLPLSSPSGVPESPAFASLTGSVYLGD